MTDDNINDKAQEILKKTRKPRKQTIHPPAYVSENGRSIWQIPEISESEKALLVESRIKSILDKQKIPPIPTLLTCRLSDSASAPPVTMLLDMDFNAVKESWDFYKVNVEHPTNADFIDIIQKVSKEQNRIFKKIVQLNIL